MLLRSFWSGLFHILSRSWLSPYRVKLGTKWERVAKAAREFRNPTCGAKRNEGQSVYNGVFNLLVLQGARDWMTGDVPQYGDPDDHHIVPV
jgi:hypothetical protein